MDDSVRPAKDLAVELNRVLVCELQPQLRCGICYSTLRSPVSPSCNHPFCKPCINSVFAKRDKIECPLCRQLIKRRSCIPATHLESLVAAYLQLTKSFLKDNKESDNLIPKDLIVMESQAVVTTQFVDSPMHDFQQKPLFVRPELPRPTRNSRSRLNKVSTKGPPAKLAKLEEVDEDDWDSPKKDIVIQSSSPRKHRSSKTFSGKGPETEFRASAVKQELVETKPSRALPLLNLTEEQSPGSVGSNRQSVEQVATTTPNIRKSARRTLSLKEEPSAELPVRLSTKSLNEELDQTNFSSLAPRTVADAQTSTDPVSCFDLIAAIREAKTMLSSPSCQISYFEAALVELEHLLEDLKENPTRLLKIWGLDSSDITIQKHGPYRSKHLKTKTGFSLSNNSSQERSIQGPAVNTMEATTEELMDTQPLALPVGTMSHSGFGACSASANNAQDTGPSSTSKSSDVICLDSDATSNKENVPDNVGDDEAEITLMGDDFVMDSCPGNVGSVQFVEEETPQNLEYGSNFVFFFSRIQSVEDEGRIQEFKMTFSRLKFASDVLPECTHVVVMNADGRHFKDPSLRYCFAIARKCVIVCGKWAFDCLSRRTVLPVDEYTLLPPMGDPEDRPAWIRSRTAKTPLFSNVQFLIPSVYWDETLVQREKVVELIELCGGFIETKLWEMKPGGYILFGPYNKDNNAALSYEHDAKCPVVSVDWLFDSISSFRRLQLDKYRLCRTPPPSKEG